MKYVGPPHTTPQSVLKKAEANTLVEAASQSESEMIAQVNNELSTKITKTQADNVANQYGSNASANNAFANKISVSQLGSTIAQLDSVGLLPTSYFDAVTTRGAMFVGWTGTMTGRTATSVNPHQTLATLNINPPGSYGYYQILAWASVETKMDSAGQTPGLEIMTGSTLISDGLGSGNYTQDWDIVESSPLPTTTVFSGARTLTLRTARRGGGSPNIIYSDYKPNFCALIIPVTYTG